jgi:protein phosphatase
MGGHRGGAIAAELTVETLNQSLSRLDAISIDPNAIRAAFEKANAVVYERGHAGNADTEGMGATAVMLLVTQCQVMVAHVGDSRAYLFTPENKLERLTKDHSRVQRMIDAGILTPAEAAVHPEASVLERAIGTSPTVKVDISSWISLREGDQILLCSDGLHGYVSDAEIAAILGNQGAPQELAGQLVNLALEKGGEDNITIQLIECEGRDKGGISRIMGRLGIIVPGIVILSAATACVTTEYRPAALKERRDIP